MIVEKLYRDPIHDLIALHKNSADDRLLMRLIDTAPVQRLRRIRQLGLAYLAYQGAEHSRFTHSIGVMHIATRILDHLAKEWPISRQQRLAVRCAALLHDVGHGPFSHVFEQVTRISHEKWTEKIITDPRSEVFQILSEYSRRLPQQVVDILAGRSSPAFLSQIITSQLDSDRFDYLLRDSLMTGVKYGVYDLERLIKVLRLDRAGDRIVIAPNGIPAVEKYLQARYHMYTQVYLHKTVRAAESMLILLLRRAASLLGQDKLATVGICPHLLRVLADPENSDLDDFLATTDDSIMYALNCWQSSTDAPLRYLANGLLKRRLFKTIDISKVHNIHEKLEKTKSLIRQAGMPPEYFFMVYESKNIAYRPYDPKEKQLSQHIVVEVSLPNGEYRDIAALSPVAAGLARATAHVRRIVFPPEINGISLRQKIEAIFA